MGLTYNLFLGNG